MAAAPRIFKVFVSSPSDVMVERRRVEAVTSRLNGEFAGVARLETVRWETEFYQAHSTFQTQIARSTECEIVIGILKWRLGTPLPDGFGENLPGGAPTPAERPTSPQRRRQTAGGRSIARRVRVSLRAILAPAYRRRSRARAHRKRLVPAQAVLSGVVRQRARVLQGRVNPYVSEDDFEAQLEKLLRKWLAEKVSAGRAPRWPIEIKGSPFRGLDAFGAKHAPVFLAARRKRPAPSICGGRPAPGRRRSSS